MDTLTVLYDQDCVLCQNCRIWLIRQRTFIKLRFIPLQSPQITEWFPQLEQCPDINPREQLVVISDKGWVYQSQSAWIMCLYALVEYREWSLRLSQPALLPFAHIACEMISRNRLRLSNFLRKPDAELAKTLREAPAPVCKIQPNSDQTDLNSALDICTRFVLPPHCEEDLERAANADNPDRPVSL